MQTMYRLRSSIVWCALMFITIPQITHSVPLQASDNRLTWQNTIDDTSSEMDYVNDNPVIEVDDSGVPVCPPAVNHPQACYAKVCRSDIDCLGTKTERACCYNGCVRTCMVKVKPPPYFDYDETDSHHQQADVGIGQGIRRGPTEVAEFQQPSIVLSLPGGCHLTKEQYETYRKFQVSPSFRQCYCLAGDIFCQINARAP